MPPKNSPEAIVLQKIQEKNRPFNSVSLGDELHNEIKQTQLKKILDQLTNDGVISCKISGKAKFYFAKQDGLTVASPEELDEFDERIAQLKEKAGQLASRVNELRAQRDKLANMKPIEELKQYRIDIENQVQVENQKKDDLIKAVEGISPEDAEKYEKNFNDRCNQWKTRRSQCKEIIDQLSEATEKKPAVLIEELGLETDESHGLTLLYKDKQFQVIENDLQ